MTLMHSRSLAIATLCFVVGCGVASAADEATVTYKSLAPDLALEAAKAALDQCRTDGFQVSVAVVDRFGEPQVLLRDRFAGLPASRTATDKAWTALGFRASTADLSKAIQNGSLDARLATLPRVTMLGGALIIEASGTLLGAIGVSGAPGGDKDEKCARSGLDAIRDKLDF
jgi:uncharacterized protein GlcG (DUF336 family)